MLNRVYQNIEIKKQDSRHWWACCPFHNDTRPSMSINKAGKYKDFYRCWSCGKSGSPANFALLTGGKDFSGFERKKYNVNIKQTPEKPSIDFKSLQFSYISNMKQRNYEAAEKLFNFDLNILFNFSIGWNHRAFTIPMYDRNGDITGFRTRLADGSKGCMSGSRLGIFRPELKFNPEKQILITEGETDCMAALAMGFQVIGRPNCNSCQDLIIQWLKNGGFKHIVIVADNDEAGIKGAEKLGKEAALSGLATKIINPPKFFKDLRNWYLDGALREDIFEAIENTDYVSPVRVKTLMNKIIVEFGGKYAKR